MNTEIAKVIGEVKNQMNELGKRIDNLYAMLCKKNEENIELNSNGEFDLAELIDDLETRVKALEGRD